MGCDYDSVGFEQPKMPETILLATDGNITLGNRAPRGSGAMFRDGDRNEDKILSPKVGRVEVYIYINI